MVLYFKEIAYNVLYDIRTIRTFFGQIKSLIDDYKTFNGWSPPDRFPVKGDLGPSCACDKACMTKFIKIEASGAWLYRCSVCNRDRRW